MKTSGTLVSRVSAILGLPSAIVAESLGTTKPDRAKIAAMTTTKEVLDAIGEVPNIDCEQSELLYKQWDVVAIQEALAAENVDEARKVFDENKCDENILSESCLIARIRWDRFSLTEVRKSKTRGELVTARDRAPRLGRAEKLADRKLDKLALKEVRTANNLRELKLAHKRARAGSLARREAIRKIAELLDKKE